MIVNAVSFLGSIIGYFTGKFTEEELKPGRIYFEILKIAVLILLAASAFLKGFNILFFIIGLILGFILRYEYFYFGILLAQNINFLNAGLVFIYGLPYGTLAFYKENFRTLFYSAVFFAVGSLAFFSEYYLVSLAAGGMISVLVFNIISFYRNV